MQVKFLYYNGAFYEMWRSPNGAIVGRICQGIDPATAAYVLVEYPRTRNANGYGHYSYDRVTIAVPPKRAALCLLAYLLAYLLALASIAVSLAH